MKSLSHVQPLATPWTAAYQALPSMGFSRQEYWSVVPWPSLRESPGGGKFGTEASNTTPEALLRTYSQCYIMLNKHLLGHWAAKDLLTWWEERTWIFRSGRSCYGRPVASFSHLHCKIGLITISWGCQWGLNDISQVKSLAQPLAQKRHLKGSSYQWQVLEQSDRITTQSVEPGWLHFVRCGMPEVSFAYSFISRMKLLEMMKWI